MESGANTRECLGGGMVDTRDLKSLGQQCPCEFESHPRHYIYGAYPRTPAPSRAFPILPGQNPGHGRSADADSLVKPFSDVFLLGISPDPCACCASALSQPQSLRDSPFQGHAGSASLRRASPLLRCLRHLADAPPRRLCGPLRESLSDFAEQSPATAPVR